MQDFRTVNSMIVNPHYRHQHERWCLEESDDLVREFRGTFRLKSMAFCGVNIPVPWGIWEWQFLKRFGIPLKLLKPTRMPLLPEIIDILFLPNSPVRKAGNETKWGWKGDIVKRKEKQKNKRKCWNYQKWWISHVWQGFQRIWNGSAGLLNHRQEKTGSPSGFASGPFSDSLAVPFSTTPNQPARKGDVRDNGHVLWAKWGWTCASSTGLCHENGRDSTLTWMSQES